MVNQTLQARLLSGSVTREQADILWGDDYAPEFESSTKDMLRLHKVPKFKKRHQSS